MAFRKKKKKKGLQLNLDKGRLHRRLGYPENKKIPVSVCRKILNTKIGQTITINGKKIKITAHDHKMANFCIVAKTKWKTGRR